MQLWTAPDVFLEDELMRKMVDTVLLSRYKLFNMSMSVFSFPGQFTALLDDDCHRAECLKELKAVADAWKAAQQQHKNAAWRAICYRSPMRLANVTEVFEHLEASGWIMTADFQTYLSNAACI